jgi:glycosyltransferase involved in cell wall biosynthesis
VTLRAEADRTPVLFLCFFPDVTKGGQKNLVNLVGRLDRERFRPVVVVPAEGPAASTFRAMGASVHVVPLGEFEPYTLRGLDRYRLGLLRRTLGRTWPLRRVLAREGVRVAYADGPADMQHLWTAALGLGVRSLWHVQTSSPDERWDALHARRVDRIVGVSLGVRERFERVPGWRGENFRLVYNGVAPDRFRPGSAAPGARERLFPGANDADVLAVCVAQVVASKGMDELVEAVARAASDAPNLRVVVLGKGDREYVAGLEARARDAGVGDRIRFAGYHEGVDALLPAANFFVLPSHVEGLPLSVLEAMAAGLAVVSTDIPGTRELVSADTGVLVAPRDAAALARALVDLAANADMRRAMGAAGRRRVESSFTLDQCVARFEAILTELAAAPRRKLLPL